MKKFIMSKVDHTDATGSPTSSSSGTDVLILQKSEHSPDSYQEEPNIIHPPLPVDPPLPVNPPLSPKKEIIDDFEVEESLESESFEAATMQSEDAMKNAKSDVSDDIPKEEEQYYNTVCRDFIRGNCTRARCKYIHNHKPIMSQLHRFYTFCHDFQNKKCFLPKCKYVHATVAEQETYYRTGYLPPHTRAHQKSNLPPPPCDNGENSINKINLTSKPPPTQPVCDKPMPVIMCIPDASAKNVARNSFEDNNLSNKNPWIDEDGLHDESKRSTKCDSCVVMESRLQFTKNKVETMTKNIQAFDDKLEKLEKKEKRLQFLMKVLSTADENSFTQANNSNLHQLQALFNRWSNQTSS